MATAAEPQTEWPLPRGLMILVGGAGAVVTVAGLRAASGIFAPTFLALILTVAVHPLRGYLARHGWPGWARTLAGIVAAYAILVTICLAMFVAMARFASLLPQYQDDFNNLITSATTWLKDFGVDQAQIDKIGESFSAGKLVSFAGDVLGGLLSTFSDLLFLVILLLFLGVDAEYFPRKLEEQRLTRSAAVTAMESFALGTRRYFVVSTVFGFIVAVLDTAFLALTPIPAPLLWGLLAFLTNYIPNVGFIIGLVPPAVLGLLVGGPGLMLLVIAVYIVLNFIIQSVIQPRVIGEAVGLSGSITFVSLVFWAWVLGPLGALLAVPLTLLVKAFLVDVDRDSAWLRPLMSGSSTKKLREP